MVEDSRRFNAPPTPQSGLLHSIGQMMGTVRGLVADAADLVAAEAHAALGTLVGMAIMAVGMGVLAGAALVTLIALIAVILVEQGLSWPWALAAVVAVCVIGAIVLGLRLKSMFGDSLFVATRRQLHGMVKAAEKVVK